MADDANETLAAAGQHLVVVVAHPDDETFGCGSLIARAAAAGAVVTVICATRGEAGERVPDAATDHLPLGVVRERELRDAAEILGVRTIELLDIADSGFDGPLPAGALCGIPIEAFADDLGVRLERLAPAAVLILDGDDGHRDHLRVRHAIELVRARQSTETRLVRSCLSRELMRRWIEEVRALHPETAYLDLDVDSLGTPEAELTAIDSSAVLDVRERAIACHRSQKSPFDGLSVELRRAFLSTDFVQDVHAVRS